MRLANRRVLITGAASGIGAETARLFAREGAKVALLDRDEDRLASVAAEIDALSTAADVSDAEAVARAVDKLADALGGLDGVVGAAGIDLLQPFAEMTPAAWRHVLSVNLDGPFNVSHAARPHLAGAGGGTIVHISSGAGLRPLPARTAYCSAKAGLVMFAKALAIDLTDDNIRVNAICPGIVDTPMFRDGLAAASDDPEAELAMVLDRYLVKRIGKPLDIANAALFLTCDESAQVTGSALAVDGGRVFH
ncbi:MAG: SDR family NAD(P)-dependent oxidoreductase [Alphaproteobacteria bacterium]